MWVNHNSTRTTVLGGLYFKRQRFLREELVSCKKGHDNGTTTKGGDLKEHRIKTTTLLYVTLLFREAIEGTRHSLSVVVIQKFRKFG